MLSDEDKRKWYNQGGILLVKNMETALKEVEGQEAQAMAQLDMQATVQPVAMFTVQHSQRYEAQAMA